MGFTIDFNPAAFAHGASEADIRKAFAPQPSPKGEGSPLDTAIYAGISITTYYIQRRIYGKHDR